MAYEPTTWREGDTITAEKLNKLEQGVKNVPEGPKGEKGDPGLKGEKGDPGTAGQKGETGKGVKSISLTTGEGGKVTGGTVTFSDDTTSPITVTVAGA